MLRLLSFVQMCKFFSHYGVRSLLVLYMIDQLRYTDQHAFGVNALFCGLIELGGIFGGVLADRYLGLRRALLLGGALLAVGYGALLYESMLLPALGVIILGGSLFSGNIMALLGLSYDENDPRRQRGFTIFYMVQNLGALISTALCVFVAARFGFRAGFLLASLGMGVGCGVLLYNREKLPQAPLRGNKSVIAALLVLFAAGLAILAFERVLLPFLPAVTAGIFLYFAVQLVREQPQMRRLLVYLGALILFYAAEDQICSTLIVFTEREVTGALPGGLLMALNPLVILLFGTLVARLRLPLITPFALVGLSFGGVALLCFSQIALSFYGVAGLVAVISIAELMVGPFVSSAASEVASQGRAGVVMGMVPISFSLAFMLSGGFSKIGAKSGYAGGFGVIAAVMLVGGISLQIILQRFKNAESRV